jgi:K+-transporting ATPase A subunit
VRVFIAAMLAVLILITAIVGSYVYAVYQSERSLCPVMAIITERPVPKPADPARNPSRVQNYRLYLAFRQAERAYHC